MRLFKILAAAAVVSMAACAPQQYVVSPPVPSGIGLAGGNGGKTTIAIDDRRSAGGKVFNSGVLPAAIEVTAGEEIDPPAFLAKHLQSELRSRGLATSVTETGAGSVKLKLRTFQMLNHRVNAYSPYVSFTFLSADIVTAGASKRIGAWIKRGKVPVWSFEEIIEPTMNEPLSLVVKELGAKIARLHYGQKTSGAEVKRMIAQLAGSKTPDYQAVYELGFTNNPAALSKLRELATHEDEYVRLAAISSLGTIGDSSSFGFLKALYEKSDGLWQDRAMALKSIGDLGGAQSKAYLANALENAADYSAQEKGWNARIIELYE